MFHSDLHLNDCPKGLPRTAIFGRVSVNGSDVSDRRGRLCPEKLATWLFMRSMFIDFYAIPGAVSISSSYHHTIRPGSQGSGCLDDAMLHRAAFGESFLYAHLFAGSCPRLPQRLCSRDFPESRPVAFFPLQFRNSLHRLLGFAERLGGEMTDYFGLIAPADFQIAPEHLLSLCGAKYLYFTHLDETQIRYGLDGESPEVGLSMRLDSGEKSYWESLKSTCRDLVSETNRKERQIQKEAGPLKFCFEERQWRQPLTALLDSKASQYRRTGREDILAARWRRHLLESAGGKHRSGMPGCVIDALCRRQVGGVSFRHPQQRYSALLVPRLQSGPEPL